MRPPTDSTACSIPNAAAELEEIVKARLQGWVQAFQLMSEHHGLVLRGKARSYYAKQLAQHTVMTATTAPIMANDIEVVSACGETTV